LVIIIMVLMAHTILVTTIIGNPNTTLDDLFGQLSSYDMHNNSLEESGDGTFSSLVNTAHHDSDHDYHDRGRQ
jgi:hypothetical protein